LEAPLGYDSDNRVADVVADENAEDPYDELEGKANTAMLREVMKDLDPREVTILRYRFGLDGDDEKTLEEVGRKFGLTRERYSVGELLRIGQLEPDEARLFGDGGPQLDLFDAGAA
jgi:DNA-directed RNA polymerase sigma subunit (sigma70/sigma32)